MRTFVGDLEADGLLDTVTQVWCGVFKSLDGSEVYKFYPGSHPNYIQSMLDFLDTVECLIMHNGHGYDWPLLKKLYNYDYKGYKIDTVVWSRLFKPKRFVPPHCPIKNKPHSVETWGYRVGIPKQEHEDWSQYSKEMLQRCEMDVEIQIRIYEVLYKESQDYNWKEAIWITDRLFEILGKQEQYGWKVNRQWMDYCIHICTRWIAKIDKVLSKRLPYVLEIQEVKKAGIYGYVKEPFTRGGVLNKNVTNWLGGDNLPISGPFSRVLFRPLDPDSRIETVDYLLSLGWIPKEWNTNDDGEQTSPKLSKDDPFEGIEDRVGKLFAKRVQIKHRRSTVEGLIKLIREDGRIPSVITNLAETGRATHAKIVNIPNAEAFFGKWMRKIFIADTENGKVLVGTDSAGCQNRMLAARVGDPEFTYTLIHGNKKDKTSIHYVNQKAIKKTTGIDVPYGMCKNLNYGFMFGAQNPKLGRMLGGGPDLGAKIREALLGVSPGFQALSDRLTKEWRSTAKKSLNKWGKVQYRDGWITGLDGRPIFIDSEHKILVYLLQSDEAIMMAAAYVFLHDWCLEQGWEWGKQWAYVGWYHDEYTAEVDKSIAKEFQALAEEAIVAAGIFYNISCPHQGDGKIGNNWYEIH